MEVNWDARVYNSLVNSLENKAKKAIELLRLRMDMGTVTEATDLLDTEVQHLKTVVKNWMDPKKPKVKGQLFLKTRRLGKTKKSSETKLKCFRQLKITLFQKPKGRKLCISSDESEDLLEKVQALGDQSESVLPGARSDADVLLGCRPVSDSPLTTDSEAANGAHEVF